MLETFRVLFAKPAHQLISQSYANYSALYSKWLSVVVSLLHYRRLEGFFVHILLHLHELSTFCAFDSLLTFDNHCICEVTASTYRWACVRLCHSVCYLLSRTASDNWILVFYEDIIFYHVSVCICAKFSLSITPLMDPEVDCLSLS